MNEDKQLEKFGNRLKELRKRKSLSQEDLAADAGLDRTYVSGCERGVRNISLLNIYKLAGALKVDASELLK
jgi:transcriptional regulator with XRE-family HTH domain